MFANWKKENLPKSLKINSIIAVGISCVSIIAWIVFVCIATGWGDYYGFDFKARKDVWTQSIVTNDGPVAMCDTHLGNMNMLEHALFLPFSWSLHGRFYGMSNEVMNEFIDDLINGVWSDWSSVSSYQVAEDKPGTVHLFVREPVEEIHVLYDMSVMSSTDCFDVLFDNTVKYWYDSLVADSVIPFFGVVQSLLSGGLTSFIDLLDSWILGLMNPTKSYMTDSLCQLLLGEAQTKAKLREYFDIDLDSTTMSVYYHYMGHSAGGLVMKAYASLTGKNATVYESPVYENSRLHEFMGEDHYIWQRLINIYSPGSVFTAAEESMSQNIKMGTGHSWLGSDPITTFCEIVAGCAMTDGFDHFCVKMEGVERYMKYWENWGRNRTDINFTRFDVPAPENRQRSMGFE